MTRQSAFQYAEETFDATKGLLDLLKRRQEIEPDYCKNMQELGSQFKEFFEKVNARQLKGKTKLASAVSYLKKMKVPGAVP